MVIWFDAAEFRFTSHNGCTRCGIVLCVLCLLCMHSPVHAVASRRIRQRRRWSCGAGRTTTYVVPAESWTQRTPRATVVTRNWSCRGRLFGAFQAENDRPWGVVDLSDFGLLVEQSSPKREILCPGCPEPPLQNIAPLALSWPEKSITVQTKKQTNLQTVNDIHTYRHVSIITIFV